MKEILPYLITLVTTVSSGLVAYFAATKKSRSDLETVKESNRFEIERLMSQHRLDLEALERKHEMEKEKAELEHGYKLELLRKEAETNVGSSVVNAMIAEAFKSPEAQKVISEAFKNANKK